jgi:hypothetical protein
MCKSDSNQITVERILKNLIIQTIDIACRIQLVLCAQALIANRNAIKIK